MNLLSNDDMLAIFRYLNPREQNRFALLSKRTLVLKARYPKDFRKPTVEITISPIETAIETKYLKWWRSPKDPERMLTISTPRRRIVIEVSSDGKLLTSNNPDSKILMESFVHRDDSISRSWWMLKIRGESVEFNDFSTWLLSKFDVSVLRFAKDNTVTRMVFNALSATKCKCFEVSIMGSLDDAMPKKKELHILYLFRKEQHNLGVNTKFRLENADAIQEYAYSHVSSMVLFGKVFIEFNPENLYKFVDGVGYGWRSYRFIHSGIQAHFQNSWAKTSDVFRICFGVMRSWKAQVINSSWQDIDFYLNTQLPDKMEKDWDLTVQHFPHDIRFHFSMEGPNFYVSAQRKPN